MYLFENVTERDGHCHLDEGTIIDDGGEILIDDGGLLIPPEAGGWRPPNIWLVTEKMDFSSAMKYCERKQAEMPKDVPKETLLKAMSSTGTGVYRRRLE